MSNPVIGFIGLGIMGKPMARNLIKAGYSLIVHNRSRAAVDELSREGAQAANSPRKSPSARKLSSRCCPTLLMPRLSTRQRRHFRRRQIGNPAHRDVDHLTCCRPQTCR